jgi:hypothetical protein
MTATEALSSVSEKLVKALPPAMTALVVLNILFLAVAIYNTRARNEVLTKIIDRCLEMPKR